MREAEAPDRESEVRIADVRDGVGVVLLHGEHDLSTAGEIRNTLVLLLERGANVILDLSETEFIDSSTIHALEDGQRVASRHGMRIGLQLDTQSIVTRVLELTGALEAWPVYRTRAEAMQALRQVRVLALVQGLHQGDEDAFRCLFRLYAPSALALARRVVRHPDLAEEIVQEAFLAVWRDPHRYDPRRGSVRAWLMGLVHHRAVDAVRREEAQRRRAEDPSSAEVFVVGDFADHVVDELALPEERRAVRAALEELPAEQRHVIELMYFSGFSQTKIAAQLDLPLGTVKSRTLLGMRRLRKLLLATPVWATTT